MVEHGHRGISVVDSLDEAVDSLTVGREAGDVVITLGAGDVNRVCASLASELNGHS